MNFAEVTVLVFFMKTCNKCLVSFSNFAIVLLIGNRTLCCPIWSVIRLVIKLDSRFEVVRFCQSLCPITIISLFGILVIIIILTSGFICILWQKSDNALTSTAASECLSQLSSLLGPSILRGRIEMHNPR